MLLGCILQTMNSTQVKIVMLLYFYSLDIGKHFNLIAETSMLLIEASEKEHNLHTQIQIQLFKVSDISTKVELFATKVHNIAMKWWGPG